jgi:hypothetical protein
MNGISTVDVLGLLVGLGLVDRPQRQLNATQVRHLQQQQIRMWIRPGRKLG